MTDRDRTYERMAGLRWTAVLLLGIALLAASPALGCPNCRTNIPVDARGEVVPERERGDYSKGINVSIFFMIGMVYAVPAALGLALYRAYRSRAPRRRPAGHVRGAGPRSGPRGAGAEPLRSEIGAGPPHPQESRLETRPERRAGPAAPLVDARAVGGLAAGVQAMSLRREAADPAGSDPVWTSGKETRT